MNKPLPKIKWWRRLHLQLAVGILLVMMALGASLAFWLDLNLRRQQAALWQWQGLALAQYIQQHQPEPLITEHGKVRSDLVRNLSMYVRLINPALELYVLDPDGRILDHIQDGPQDQQPQLTHVELDPIWALERSPQPELPIYGSDPLQPDIPNLISAARIEVDGSTRGFLYVILRGARTTLLTMDAMADPLRSAAWRFVPLLLIVAAGLTLAIQLRLTLPLTRLAQLLRQFMPEPTSSDPPNPPPGDEIEQASQAAKALQLRVHRQLAQIERSEQHRRELIASISHDLHTPLVSIQGYAETLVLQQDSLSPEQRSRHLHTLLQNCYRLERRVNDLFELSKLESGYTQASCEPFEIAELANDVVQGLQLLASSRGVSLTMATIPQAQDNQLQVHADIGMIERVLQNLIDNAIGHTPPGGQVELRIAALPQQVTVEVADSGEGIAPQDQPYIFDRFWSGERAEPAAPHSERRSRARTGLGLAIVQCILALHNSQPYIRSELGTGTAISFELKRV